MDKNWDFCQWKSVTFPAWKDDTHKKTPVLSFQTTKLLWRFFNLWTWKVKRSLATRNCGLKGNPSRLSSGVEWASKLLGTLCQKHPRDHRTMQMSPDVEAVFTATIFFHEIQSMNPIHFDGWNGFMNPQRICSEKMQFRCLQNHKKLKTCGARKLVPRIVSSKMSKTRWFPNG